MRFRALLACCLALAPAAGIAIAGDLHPKVDPWVIERSQQGPVEFLVMLREQADRFVREEVIPNGDAWENAGAVPRAKQ